MILDLIPLTIAVIAIYHAVALYNRADKKRKAIQEKTKDYVQLLFTSRLAFGTATISFCYVLLGIHWMAFDDKHVPEMTDLAWNALESLTFGFLAQSCRWARDNILAKLDSVAIERHNVELSRLNMLLEKKQRQIEAENDILQMIASGAVFFEVAQKICEHAERFHPKIKCSILILKNGKLYDFWSPSLSQSYKDLMTDGFPPGPGNGACGAAAHFKDFFFVSDIENDENWVPFPAFQDEVRAMGIKAVWSTAILDSHDNLLGTVAFYSTEVRHPEHHCIDLLNWACRVSGIAIERMNIISEQQDAQNYRDALLRAIPDLVFVHDAEGFFYDCYTNDKEILSVPCNEVIGRHISDFIDQDTAADCAKMFPRILSTQEPDSVEYELEVAGQIRHYEARFAPLSSDRLLSVVRDISQLKAAQSRVLAQLVAQQKVLQECLDGRTCPQSPDGICGKGKGIIGDKELACFDCGRVS